MQQRTLVEKVFLKNVKSYLAMAQGKFGVPRQDADDVVQATFETLIKMHVRSSYRRLEPDVRRIYRYRTVRSRSMDLHRKNTRRKDMREEVKIYVETIGGRVETPEERVAAKERIAQVTRCVEKATETERKVIKHHFFDGKSLRTVPGVSRRKAEIALARFLKRCRSDLSQPR